jgi:hypothetical protein
VGFPGGSSPPDFEWYKAAGREGPARKTPNPGAGDCDGGPQEGRRADGAIGGLPGGWRRADPQEPQPALQAAPGAWGLRPGGQDGGAHSQARAGKLCSQHLHRPKPRKLTPPKTQKTSKPKTQDHRNGNPARTCNQGRRLYGRAAKLGVLIASREQASQTRNFTIFRVEKHNLNLWYLRRPKPGSKTSTEGSSFCFAGDQ